ncbi:Thiol:disulfide interchange protein DsbD N-terminal domain-containing protein [Desulfarculales bacterium]
MAVKRILLLFIFTTTLPMASGLAWGTARALAAGEPPTITVQVVHSLTAYTQDASYPLVLRFAIRPGFHINAQRPSEPDIYSTGLTWEQNQSFVFNPAIFPSPHAYKPSFAAGPMEVYDGQLGLRVNFKVAANATPGPHVVKAKLEFQACDEQSCLMPETLEIPVTIIVAPAGKPGKPLNIEVFRQTDMPKGKQAGGKR